MECTGGTLYNMNKKTKQTYIKKINANSSLTEFQKKALKVTLDIPKGRTRSYGWVASRVGSPRAARATGQALSINPYAPDVPCHRVVRSDGTIGGYTGGIAKKRRLLKTERRAYYATNRHTLSS